MLELARERIEARRASREDNETSMDEPHAAIWQAVRHLFPRSAVVTQTDHDCMMITWLLERDFDSCARFAAPVMIRLLPGLLLALWTCDPDERHAIAMEQEFDVSEQLADYDANTRTPRYGMVVLGEG